MCTKDNEGTLLVYNSFSGAFMEFGRESADLAYAILYGEPTNPPPEVLSILTTGGFLVPTRFDEMAAAKALHDSFSKDGHFSLILMPFENCNFRCVYCYEEFKRNRMSRDIIKGVVELVKHEADAGLRNLNVSWFGGEPLASIDIIDEISRQILDICKDKNVRFSSSMTTNGYLLTGDVVDRCFYDQISKFQITLDGPAEAHNKLRVLAGGGSTYNTILANLIDLKKREEDFRVRIRVNFTADTIPSLPKFVKFMGNHFAGDPRFSIHFHAVGHWGGEQDDKINICDQRTAVNEEMSLMAMALEEGFSLDGWKESMQMFGSICYAADPRSFVIGADGTIYKCTVAFNDPRNQIGKISADGRLKINENLHRLWTSSGEEVDSDCQECAYRPPCQGNNCPLVRLNGGKQCATVKTEFVRMLPLLARDVKRSSLNKKKYAC